MSNQLEWSCENYFISLFALKPAITNLIPAAQIRHFDDDDQADEDGLIVQAVQGERHLDGGYGHFDVELHVLLRSFSLSSQDNEVVIDAVVDAVYDPAQATDPALQLQRDRFSYLRIEDEMSGERTNTKQSRKREKVFPLLAKGA